MVNRYTILTIIITFSSNCIIIRGCQHPHLKNYYDEGAGILYLSYGYKSLHKFSRFVHMHRLLNHSITYYRRQTYFYSLEEVPSNRHYC